MLEQAGAEYLAMTLFVFIGPAIACSFPNPPFVHLVDQSFPASNSLPAAPWDSGAARIFGIAFGFGMAIFVLVCGMGHTSGGQINPAVTWGLVVAGHLSPVQGAVNFIAQMAGALTGGGFLAAVITPAKDGTCNLGCNQISDGYQEWNALWGEIIMTGLLMFTVLETAVNPKQGFKHQAPLAIGFSVFLSHMVLIPIDGCSINPARTFGTLMVHLMRSGGSPTGRGCGYFDDRVITNFWVFWVGPILGASIAAGICRLWWGNEYLKTIAEKKDKDEAALEIENEAPKATASPASGSDAHVAQV